MPIDPLTGLGIAANVLQFVDFASKLVRGSNTIYKSASALSEDNTVLETVAHDIQRLSDSIVAPEGCSDALKQLIDESSLISQELLAALDKLRIKGQKTRWKSFVVTVRGMWSQDEVESIAARLGRLQAQIIVRLQILIGNEIAKISSAMDHLKSTDYRLGLRQAAERRAFRETLVQSVERVIQKKLHDVHRSEAALPQLAEHIDLGKVTELPATMRKFHEELRNVEAKLSNTTDDYQMLQTLYFDNIWARHDRIAMAHSNTFIWIFKGVLPDSDEPIEYVKWLREKNDVFWIHGKPGSGKSTLMKFLVHHPDTTSHLQAWARDRRLVVGRFFFWNSGTKLQKSQEGLLRSLLFEILRQFPGLLAGVYEAITGERHGSRPAAISAPSNPWLPSHSTGVSWSLQNLFKAFEYLRGQKIAAKFCFFIDGLDEYKDEDNRDHRDLIKVLCGLAESPNIKLCLSSRSWTAFKDAFGGNLETTIKLEDLTRKDIRHYVNDSFDAHEQFQRLSLMDPSYADLVDEVVRKAQGVFLWVFLVLRDLLEGLTYNDTIKTMRLRLDRFPDDLDAYFRHIFDSIHKVYRVQTARSFQIAMSRDEPLPLILYSFVDDVEEDPSLNYNTAFKLAADQIEEKLAIMWRRLEGRSKGLLEVVVSKTENIHGAKVDYSVEFLHRTVRDFLVHTPDIQDEMMESLENKYQTWVLLCCATSLMIKSWQEGILTVCLRQLFYFARLAVADSGDEDIVDDVLLQVFQRAKTSTAVSGEAHDEGSYQRPGFFDIFLASEYGLVSYVKKQLPWRLRLIEEQSTADQEKKKASILGGVLRYALLGEDSYCKLSPELVEYLVSLGSPANHLCKVEYRDMEATVFYHFLRRVQKEEISSKDPAVLEILQTLVAHNADLNARVSFDPIAEAARIEKGQASKSSEACAKDIIYRCFTVDEVDWLLSRSTKSALAEPKHCDIRVPTARQRNEDGIKFRLADGPTIHHAQTADADKQGGKCLPDAPVSTTSAPKRLHNDHFPVNVDNVSRNTVGLVWHTGVLKKRPAAIQCYNCQQLGHKAINCGKPQICAKCANKGHHHSSCRATFTKCALCAGPHPSFGQSCPKLRFR